LELSPIHLQLRAEAYGAFPAFLQRLPGLIADCLPDGWGLLLMDRFFRRHGRDPAACSPLDRLAFLGDRAMGAFTFEPAEKLELPECDRKLLQLAREIKQAIAGRDREVLKELVVLGGSPQGARPKVLVYYDPESGSISTHAAPGHRPVVVKFPAREEHKEVCAIEDTYAHLARLCGLDVPDTWHFSLDRSLAAFGIARFDREGAMRVPMHTLAGVLHADFRVPSVDYTTFLRATRLITRDEREVRQAYQRAAFNVLFNNRDDHSKNISFRLSRDRSWHLSPCYDLTFSMGPGGEHQMDVCGEGREITREHMLRLAQEGGLKSEAAAAELDRLLERADVFQRLAKERPIRVATVKAITAAINANRERLNSD
jgi:serine/threonine-protein kinase HipA